MEQDEDLLMRVAQIEVLIYLCGFAALGFFIACAI